jgi:hypothetical protein
MLSLSGVWAPRKSDGTDTGTGIRYIRYVLGKVDDVIFMINCKFDLVRLIGRLFRLPTPNLRGSALFRRRDSILSRHFAAYRSRRFLDVFIDQPHQAGTRTGRSCRRLQHCLQLPAHLGANHVDPVDISSRQKSCILLMRLRLSKYPVQVQNHKRRVTFVQHEQDGRFCRALDARTCRRTHGSCGGSGSIDSGMLPNDAFRSDGNRKEWQRSSWAKAILHVTMGHGLGSRNLTCYAHSFTDAVRHVRLIAAGQ